MYSNYHVFSQSLKIGEGAKLTLEFLYLSEYFGGFKRFFHSHHTRLLLNWVPSLPDNVLIYAIKNIVYKGLSSQPEIAITNETLWKADIRFRAVRNGCVRGDDKFI